MCLWIDSDTSFASIRNARRRVGDLFYLSLHPSKKSKHHNPPLNGQIFVLCIIMKMVLSSAAEAEYGRILINTKEGVLICTTLQELGTISQKRELLSKQTTTQRTVLYTITYAKKIALFWHGIPLDPRSFQTRLIQHILETRSKQKSRLRHQTPFPCRTHRNDTDVPIYTVTPNILTARVC